MDAEDDELVHSYLIHLISQNRPLLTAYGGVNQLMEASWHFVEDQIENGARFRILTLLDEHSRCCLAVHVGWSIRAVDVIAVVEAAFAR